MSPRAMRADRPIDYNRTFLRQHIASEWRRYDDILPLVAIRKRVSEQWKVEGGKPSRQDLLAWGKRLEKCPWLTPRRFFYERRPDLVLYHEVPLVRTKDNESFTIPSLTRWLCDESSRPGVLLRARAGAGKSLAARRAFFDCLTPRDLAAGDTEEAEPRLFGYLPCWLNLEKVYSALDGAIRPDRTVTQLLLDTAKMTANSIALVEAWLRAGPSLLIFVEMNAVHARYRSELAARVRAFIDRWKDAGHRIVLTYRTFEDPDPISNVLGDTCDTCDLDPLPEAKFATYPRNFASYLQEVATALQLKMPEEPASSRSIVAEKLKLLRQYAGQGTAMMSTPLLMHLVTQLDSRAVSFVKSPSDLYRALIDEHLRRDQQSLPAAQASQLQGFAGMVKVLSLLARCAVMLHKYSQKSLSIIDLRSLLRTPRESTIEALKSVCDATPYEREVLPDEATTAFLEVSLLSNRAAETNGVGFLHDSLIDYLVGAVRLGEYLAPYDPPPARDANRTLTDRKLLDDWFTAVAELWRTNPRQWAVPAGFVAGTLTENEYVRLLTVLLQQEAREGDRQKSDDWLALLIHFLVGSPCFSPAPPITKEIKNAIAERQLAKSDDWLAALYDQFLGDLPIVDRS